MRHPIDYTPNERAGLVALSAFGFVALNGAFFYGLLFRFDAVADAVTNPIAVAFIAEAFVLVGLFASLSERWRVSRLG